MLYERTDMGEMVPFFNFIFLIFNFIFLSFDVFFYVFYYFIWICATGYARGLSQGRFGQVSVVLRKAWHDTQIGIGHVGVG